MNTIKFSPILDERKETHNVEVYDIKNIKLDNNNLTFFGNAQISLYITKNCNGSCPFCINNFQHRFQKCQECDDKCYLKNLNRVLEAFKEIKPHITISGGEPTKSPRLIDILRILKESDYKIRSLTTNGTGLFDKYEGKPVIAHMVDNGAIHNINISRMHISDEENKRIMGESISNEEIKRIFTYGHVNNMDIRLSCNLLKSGIKDLESIIAFHDFYDLIGAETVMFRELLTINNDEKSYNDEKISIEPVFKEIKANKDFEYVRTLDGWDYKVDVYKYKNKIVKCYHEKNEIKENQDNGIIREFVLYPDGNLDDGFNGKIVLKRED